VIKLGISWSSRKLLSSTQHTSKPRRVKDSSSRPANEFTSKHQSYTVLYCGVPLNTLQKCARRTLLMTRNHFLRFCTVTTTRVSRRINRLDEVGPSVRQHAIITIYTFGEIKIDLTVYFPLFRPIPSSKNR